MRSLLVSIFLLTFNILSGMLPVAYAVEPIHVDFGAKREGETTLIAELNESFEGLKAARIEVRSNPRSLAVSNATALILKKVMNLQQLWLSNWNAPNAALRSSALQRNLINLYSANLAGTPEERIFVAIPELLIQAAHRGWMTEATVVLLVEKLPSSRLEEVLPIALKRNPSLRTAHVNTLIHEKFFEIVQEAKSTYQVSKPLFEIVDPNEVLKQGTIARRLYAFTQDTYLDGYEVMLVRQPAILARLSKRFSPPDRKILERADRNRADDIRGSDGRRLMPEDEGYSRQFQAVQIENRLAALMGSRDRIHDLFQMPGAKVDRRFEIEILNALDVFEDLSEMQPASLDPYVRDLSSLAVMSDHDDKVRKSVMRVIRRLAVLRPELRSVYFDAALKLELPIWQTVEGIKNLMNYGPLTERERDQVLQFVERKEIAALTADTRPSLQAIRRKLMRPISGSTCSALFTTFSHPQLNLVR